VTYNKRQAEHCRQRMWQRFQIVLPSWQIQQEIKEKIDKGECLKIQKQTLHDGDGVYCMVYRGEKIKAVHCADTDTIVTVIP